MFLQYSSANTNWKAGCNSLKVLDIYLKLNVRYLLVLDYNVGGCVREDGKD
jgi:hypothetical protein